MNKICPYQSHTYIGYDEIKVENCPIQEYYTEETEVCCYDSDYKNCPIYNLQSKIDKANEILEEILVVRDWEHEGRFRPVKGTTAQDVYKTIIKLNELLETPRKINYELLKEDK